jgi:hypothetical protein
MATRWVTGSILLRWLDGIADPSGICLSEDAYRRVHDGSGRCSSTLGKKNSRTLPGRCEPTPRTFQGVLRTAAAARTRAGHPRARADGGTLSSPLGQNRASGLRWISGACGIEAGRSGPHQIRCSAVPSDGGYLPFLDRISQSKLLHGPECRCGQGGPH